jgi:hypothetical protein
MKNINEVQAKNVIQKGDRIATVSEVARTPDGEISSISAHFGAGIPLKITSDFSSWEIIKESW